MNQLKLEDIKARPTAMEDAGKIHESVFRSYHILNMVIEMIKRGDSTLTILELVNYLDECDRSKIEQPFV